jgi:hypothetical protein
MVVSTPIDPNSGTRITVARMKTTLNIAGDAAGTANLRSEFSMPMNARGDRDEHGGTACSSA